jgi:hypothetical protein
MKWWLVIAAGLLAAPAGAFAQPRATGTVGAGVSVGDPTGITAELVLGRSQSVEALMGLDRFNEGDLYFHLLWKIYPIALVQGAEVDVPLYLGVGPWLAAGEYDLRAGVRAPLGIALELRRAPVQIFFEIAGVVEVVGAGRLDGAVALGVRYYFSSGF